MLKKTKTLKLLYLAVFSILVICISTGYSQIKKQKQVFEIKTERITENYSVKTEKGTNIGNLYELDILFTSDVNSEMVNVFVDKIDIPEGVISVNVRFYNNYNENSETQKYNYLKYEVSKLL